MDKDYDRVINICENQIEKGWQYPGIYGLLLSSYIQKGGYEYEQKKEVFYQGIKSLAFKDFYRMDDYLLHETYFNFYSIISSNAKTHRAYQDIIKYSRMAELYLTDDVKENDTDWQNIYTERAFAYAVTEKYDLALKDYLYVVNDLKIKDAESYNSIGLIYKIKGNNKEARKYYEKAIKLGDETAKNNLKILEESEKE